MWICSKLGFFSIVRKDGWFHVRARKLEDLEKLRKACGWGGKNPMIEKWPNADYRWRIRMNAVDLSEVMTAFYDSIDYPNFKSEIAKSRDQREKLPAYHNLWADLAALPQPARNPSAK